MYDNPGDDDGGVRTMGAKIAVHQPLNVIPGTSPGMTEKKASVASATTLF
jgi:hypothetical protein